MQNFTLKLSVLAIVLGLASTAIFYGVPKLPISRAFPYILLFLFSTTLIIFLALEKSMKKRTSQFTNAVMLVNFSKLLFYGIIIFVYAYLNRSGAVSFILTFFVYYFAFTTFEVFALLKIGKK
ncbi:MAG: hypothetical protein DRI89_03340 [Bacteroidetes bacterium]|nr:MAG: hypothetical protein DRI89_03340 [Bacteroidota bacterium]